MTSLRIFGGAMLIAGFHGGLALASALDGREVWPYLCAAAGQVFLAWTQTVRLHREVRR